MLKITQIKLPIGHDEDALKKSVCRILRVKESRIKDYRIARRAVDARHKEDLKYVYTVYAELRNEEVYTAGRHKNIMFTEPVIYRFPYQRSYVSGARPVVIGTGPAGLFCALFLAENGFSPLIVERGSDVDKRTAAVNHFWNGGELDPGSNVQFGEGGAGTFSDGKLNTGITDRSGRVSEVLRVFNRFGGPDEILFDSAPHLGTDLLRGIVKNIRTHIISCGGEFLFDTCVSDISVKDNALKSLVTSDGRIIDTDVCVLAPGHSARDTFLMLKRRGLRISPKPFSAGVRLIHPQELINEAQWGPDAPAFLGAAPYKLSAKTADGRGVYTFCMCPGGYVVNASSERGMLAVNGMSYSARSSGFANSAVVSGINVEDCLKYADDIFKDELSGIAFQQKIESLAYSAGGGHIPVQEYDDFRRGVRRVGNSVDAVKGSTAFADLTSVLPEGICRNISLGIEHFGKIISGFDSPDVPLLGVESRTSSPVRLERNEDLEGSIRGIFPCGEGAGYAGGITSAAADGIRVAEACSKRLEELYGNT